MFTLILFRSKISFFFFFAIVIVRSGYFLPLWASPIQLRVIPVSSKYLDFCKNLSFPDNIRWDIDDSDNRFGKKIVQAKFEWGPYVLVVGDKEIESGIYPVERREDNCKQEYQKEYLEKEILERCKEYPKVYFSLPRLLSKRPIFYG